MEINQLYPELTSYIIRKMLDDKIINSEKLIFLLQHAKDINSSEVVLPGLNMLLTGKLNIIPESQEFQIPNLKSKQEIGSIVINGLKWDVRNVKIGKCAHFTFDKAQEIAKNLGKRCPTTEEFEQLLLLGYTFDKVRKGMWIAGNFDTDHKGSLFFPAAGHRDSNNKDFCSTLAYGYYWSSFSYTNEHAQISYMYFDNNGTVNPKNASCRAYGFSVRCVQDIKNL